MAILLQFQGMVFEDPAQPYGSTVHMCGLSTQIIITKPRCLTNFLQGLM